MKYLIIPFVALALASPAYAHPDEPEVNVKPKVESKAATKTFSWDGEELQEAARELEKALQDTEVISEFADMFAAFASSVEVKRDDDGATLMFDGDELMTIERETSRDSEDKLSISGLGKNLSLQRETVVVDGQSKTRIVIEMDGADDVEIELDQE